jgi:uncharacterized damage-inducible protein DinB
MPTSEDLAAEFIRVARHELAQSLDKIRKVVPKLTAEQLWARGHKTENAVGNLLLHLGGNVRQWIVCGLGGAEDRRERDAEFAAQGGAAATELLDGLAETVAAADAVLARLSPQDLLEQRPIQVYQVSGLQAVFHVVEHFGEHTGQILWAVKAATGEDLGFYRHLTGAESQPGESQP